MINKEKKLDTLLKISKLLVETSDLLKESINNQQRICDIMEAHQKLLMAIYSEVRGDEAPVFMPGVVGA